MSRRVTDKHELDYYNDFLVLPVITQPADPVDAYPGFTAQEYGTGFGGIATPASLGDPEAGHPGILKLHMDDNSDNATIQFKQGVLAQLKDWTRFTCTFRIVNLIAAEEWGWIDAGFLQQNVWGHSGGYVFRTGGAYQYARPNEWYWPGSYSDVSHTYQGGLNDPLASSEINTLLVEWHNMDIRLDYEAATIKHYLDGQLVAEEINVPEIMWDNPMRPSFSCGDYPNANDFLIDEWGWSTRKVDIDGEEVVEETSRIIRPGTTRRDNQG